MQGDSIKALKIVSRAKGWDPDVIYDVTKDGVSKGADIGNFNSTFEIFSNQQALGKLPEGTPDSFPSATDPVLGERTTFAVPDAGRETASRRTTGADPNAGKG